MVSSKVGNSQVSELHSRNGWDKLSSVLSLQSGDFSAFLGVSSTDIDEFHVLLH